jgi:hypothetical protein
VDSGLHAHRDDVTLELDFSVFVEGYGGREDIHFAAGEAKAGDQRFGQKDFRVCETFSRLFPGAAFVFATMRVALTAGERRRIAALARRGRALHASRWRTPIVVLTRAELESRSGPPFCWDAIATAEGIRQRYRDDHTATELERLARATQALHLGVAD